ncbi:MAG: peptidase, partial [Halobacteriales archaeon]
AILRPGRFDRLIEVPKPDFEGRKRILEIHTGEMNVADSVDFGNLAEATEGFTGAELASLATESGMFAVRDDRREVVEADFEDALEKLKDDQTSDVVPSAGFY